MRLSITFFCMLLLAATLTLSYCPKNVSALTFDKSNLRHHPQNQATNRRIINAVNVTGRDVGQESHRRSARCLDLFDWIYDYFEPESTTATTTTATTTTTTSATTKTEKPGAPEKSGAPEEPVTPEKPSTP